MIITDLRLEPKTMSTYQLLILILSAMINIPNSYHQETQTADIIMRIKIFISVLWSLHNMPHAWEAYGQKKKRKKKKNCSINTALYW